MNKKVFLLQGVFLACVGILMRSGNIFYRSYLSQKIGSDGMGLYQLIFSIFVLAVTLSTSGISLAVTRLVSSCITSNKKSQIRSVVNRSLSFCLCLSLIISISFVVFSDLISENFLGNLQASNCLKILGLGLPFMSLCTCMKGYFLAVEENLGCGFAELFEQILTIGTTILILTIFPTNSIEEACFFAMVGSTIGEIGSFLINITAIKISLHKNTPKKKEVSTGVLYSMTHIALPCTLSSAARSLLSSCENILIPIQLQLSGYSYNNAMSTYGILHAMAFPILYFPSAFIAPFAVLLIPKICKEKDLSHKNAVGYVTNRAISLTLSFGIISSFIFFNFGSLLGEVFYANKESGIYISLIAPIVPLMYLDIVVDCLLKGIDEQLNSMKYNIFDSSIRILLILILMRTFGIDSYIFIIFFSTIFNASLSITKVISKTKPKFNFLPKLLYQIPSALFSVFIGGKFNFFNEEYQNLILIFLISYSTYAILCKISSKLLAY